MFNFGFLDDFEKMRTYFKLLGLKNVGISQLKMIKEVFDVGYFAPREYLKLGIRRVEVYKTGKSLVEQGFLKTIQIGFPQHWEVLTSKERANFKRDRKLKSNFADSMIYVLDYDSIQTKIDIAMSGLNMLELFFRTKQKKPFDYWSIAQ